MSNNAWHLAATGARECKKSLNGPGVVGAVALVMALMISGCHSAYVNATITNHMPTPISVVQVEYPSASFGTQTIAPGQSFNYRFKVLGSGTLKVTYTDAAQVEHKMPGPPLKEGDEGSLTVVVEAGKTDFNLALAPK
jgi:hypothetical protein